MTRDVLISIKGLYSVRDAEGNTDDSVEVFSPGKYYFRNGKHYVEYEEPEDDDISETGEKPEAGERPKSGTISGNDGIEKDSRNSGSTGTERKSGAAGGGKPEDGDMPDGTSGAAAARSGVIRTRITLRGRRLEVIRKGIVNTKMVFEEGVKNNCWYDTVAGSMLMGIDVSRMQITESEELIEILVNYALEANYEHLTDNSIRIRIMAKDSGLFHLA